MRPDTARFIRNPDVVARQIEGELSFEGFLDSKVDQGRPAPVEVSIEVPHVIRSNAPNSLKKMADLPIGRPEPQM